MIKVNLFGLWFCFFCKGQGTKVTFVLNQDFHDGYADDNSAAYNILARNVKKEVRYSGISVWTNYLPLYVLNGAQLKIVHPDA